LAQRKNRFEIAPVMAWVMAVLVDQLTIMSALGGLKLGGLT
jgi:hypothetical protein